MKIISRLNCLPFVLSSALIFTSPFILAKENSAPPIVESKWDSATDEELSNEINRIAEEIRKSVDLSNATKKKLEFIDSDLTFTSEAVEVKRKVLRSAEATLIKAQIELRAESEAVEVKTKALKDAEAALVKAKTELRAEVANLPEIQKISADNEKLEASIIALRLKNTALVKLFRSRKKSPTHQ